MSKISKLGLGIVVFDDTFHLKNITTEVRDLCDEITICLQHESYYNEPISHDVVNYVNTLKEEGLVDSIIWFNVSKKYDNESDFIDFDNPIRNDGSNPLTEEQLTEIKNKREEDHKNVAPRLIETDKRNFILDYLENTCHCSHSIVIDSDEFYDHDDFKNSKELINKKDDIHVSYCQYINYYRDYIHLMVWPFICYVPFISEASYRYDFKNGSFDKPSDPTRRFRLEGEGAQYCILSFKTVKMHHLSWIRKNIEHKLDNWSSKMYFKDNEGLIERILDRYNNYRDGQNAILMFNTPNNEVVVNKLTARYINPKYSLLDL